MTPPAVKAPPVTERQFLRQVIDLARVSRWKTYHTQLSKWSEAGWPDLALLRRPRLVLAELKSDKGKLTLAQQEWVDELAACGGFEVYVWRPADLEEIARILR
jgi:hypothetical protein